MSIAGSLDLGRVGRHCDGSALNLIEAPCSLGKAAAKAISRTQREARTVESRGHAPAPVAHHRRRQLPAARLAGEPPDAVEGVPRTRMRDLARTRAVPGAGAGRRHALAIRDMERAGIDIITDGEIRRESYSNRFATALEGLDLDQPGDVKTRTGHRDARAARGRQDPPHARRSSCATCSSCAPTPLPAKITLPGPFTMSQQAKNEFYRDDEEMAMDFAAAVNAEARDWTRGRRRHPARRAMAAQRPGGRQALRGPGHQPRTRGHGRCPPSCTCVSAMRRWCRASEARGYSFLPDWRTASRSRSRSRPRSRSSTSAS